MNDPLFVPLTRPKTRKVDALTVPVLMGRSNVTETLAVTATLSLLTGLVDDTCICAGAVPAQHTTRTTISELRPMSSPRIYA